jgi:hypothetical protein
VYLREAAGWGAPIYVKASNTGQYDRFGISVDVSGTTFVCGASGEASLATGINGTSPGQADNSGASIGAAYIFR